MIHLPIPWAASMEGLEPPLNAIYAAAMVLHWQRRGADLLDESTRKVGPSMEVIRNEAAAGCPSPMDTHAAVLWWKTSITGRDWTLNGFRPFDATELVILLESVIMAYKMGYIRAKAQGMPVVGKEPPKIRRAEVIMALGYSKRSVPPFLFDPSSDRRAHLPLAASHALAMMAANPFGPPRKKG